MRAQKSFACAGIFLLSGVFVFLAVIAFAPPGVLASSHTIDPATCAPGDTCTTNCSCCDAQTVSCPAGSAKTYDICLDANGVRNGNPAFCGGSAPNPAQCVGGAAGSSNCFRCFAGSNPFCNSTSESIDISDPSKGTFNYSCSTCVVGTPVIPPPVLPPGESCTVTWETVPATAFEGANLEITLRGERTLSSEGHGWANVMFGVDGGGWNNIVDVLDLTPRFRFTVNAGSPGPHTLRFGVNDGAIVCTSLGNDTFTTKPSIGGTPSPFDISIGFGNPLKAKNFTELLDRLLDVLLVISGSLVVLMIVWAAFLFVTSQGVPQRIQQAKDAVKWAFIGFLIVLFAKGIFNIVNTILPFS